MGHQRGDREAETFFSHQISLKKRRTAENSQFIKFASLKYQGRSPLMLVESVECVFSKSEWTYPGLHSNPTSKSIFAAMVEFCNQIFLV